MKYVRATLGGLTGAAVLTIVLTIAVLWMPGGIGVPMPPGWLLVTVPVGFVVGFSWAFRASKGSTR